MRNAIGGLRRSHVVTTYGPGAIIDFRAPKTGAPLSGVLSGLEEWDDASKGRPGLMHPQVIHEPRLEKRLGVKGFRLPPVKLALAGKVDESTRDVLPVVRFPDWLQCPRCNRLKRADDWNKDPGEPERRCGECAEDEGEKVWVVPVRFVAACEDGHLGEFPWQGWIGCICARPKLSLRMDGPGLAGKVVACGACKKERSLEGVFERFALSKIGHGCTGHEPWLALSERARCSKPARALQRGASNVYWGVTQSALDIPPYSPDPSELFGPHWASVLEAEPADWPSLLKILKLPEKLSTPASVLLKKLHEWHAALASDDAKQDVKWDEYKQFQRALAEPIKTDDFETRPTTVPQEFRTLLGGVALARRLREVRAQKGFTRILPPAGMFRASDAQPGRISKAPLDWLPAIEMRGEGIFVSFNSESLTRWESQPEVDAHVDGLAGRLLADLVRESRTPGEAEAARELVAKWRPHAARFVLIHSFSHALMRRLSLECGYSSSALRERLYVNREGFDMMGVLVHTDSPDSEGTLGGLVRQGHPDRLHESLVGMLRDAEWCSSDPVCITGTMTLSTPRNGAACHACLLAPETSCEHFNTLLDRALLVGTPTHPGIGYFRAFLEELQ